MSDEEGSAFLRAKLGELAQRRTELERGMVEVEAAIAQVKRERVTADNVRAALARVGEVYGCLKPFEQKELMRLRLKLAVNSRSLYR